MSRIGKKPILLPNQVSVLINKEKKIIIKGPKGNLSIILDQNIDIKINKNNIIVDSKCKAKTDKSMWGITRTLINNMIIGVNQGFTKKLNISGIGYKAKITNNILYLTLGFSHEVKFIIPNNINITCPKPIEIIINGIDKYLVGQVAAKIRNFRPPEPYKGKGIKYDDEFIIRKEGKKK